MKVKPRKTNTRVIARRITSPETQVAKNGKKILLLSFIDVKSNQRHVPTKTDLFLYAAGRNEEGELPDGLDRLIGHQYRVHLDGKDGAAAATAIGLDIVPAKVSRSGVVPKSQRDVTVATVTWELDGAVCRVTKRPPGTRPEQLFAVIRELDKLIEGDKDIEVNTKLGNFGTVVSTGYNTLDIRLKAGRRVVPGADPGGIDAVVAGLDD